MKWSWKLGTVAGIGLYVHATFGLLIVWWTVSFWLDQRSLLAVADGVGFLLAIFGCVVLHEFGHALTAKRYGIRTRDITLLPIGGVARLERMPDQPMQEFWVAVAGPAVNVVIAAVLYLLLVAGGTPVSLRALSMSGGSFLGRLLFGNLVLVGFNLIPAFPMDGGRVLRALLALRLPYTRATQIAATLGQGIALLFGLAGLTSSNYVLLFIALFVWIGAAQESSMVQMRSALGGIPVHQAMLTEVRTVAPHDTLARAVELILAQSQPDFPVVDGDRVVGVLVRNDLLGGLQGAGRDARVSDVMQREFVALDPADMLEGAVQRLQECRCHAAPVVRDGRLVGLLTMDNLGEFLAIQAALEKRGAGSRERGAGRSA
jgi:Zn-dependent protease/CBS domain-containing protein